MHIGRVFPCSEWVDEFYCNLQNFAKKKNSGKNREHHPRLALDSSLFIPWAHWLADMFSYVILKEKKNMKNFLFKDGKRTLEHVDQLKMIWSETDFQQ